MAMAAMEEVLTKGDPEDPLLVCCFCDVLVPNKEKKFEKLMTSDQVRKLQGADLDTVSGILDQLGRILDNCGGDCKSPFVTVTYTRGATTGATDLASTFLYQLMKKSMLGSSAEEQDYDQAMERILSFLENKAKEEEKKRKLIQQLLGQADSGSGRTVLHLAASKWGREVVRRLMGLGANIGDMDHSGEVAVTNINPELIKDFIDDKWSPENGDPDTEDYSVTFNYLFLQDGHDEASPTMKTVLALSESQQHRHLLIHPVITTFIALQWKHFAHFYYINTIFTFLTCLIINLFILRLFGGSSLQPLSIHTNWESCDVKDFPSVHEDGPLQVLWWTLLVLTALLATRELIQVVADKTDFFCSLENWLEVFFIVATFALIGFSSNSGQSVCHMRGLAATILLTSWIMFFGMIGRHPNMQHHNIYITMFFKVMKRFFKIFLAFMPYIVALGLFFYVSLHQDERSETPESERYSIMANIQKEIQRKSSLESKADQEELIASINEQYKKHKQEILDKIDEKGEFMNKAGSSVLKSMAMFVGELEFSDIRFENLPYFSHISFFLFVVLFVVVLMNYLTGIAVSSPLFVLL